MPRLEYRQHGFCNWFGTDGLPSLEHNLWAGLQNTLAIIPLGATINALTVWSAAVLFVRWLNVTLLQHEKPATGLSPCYKHCNCSLLKCREREMQQQCMAGVWHTLQQQQAVEICV